MTGEGLAELKETLHAQALALSERESSDFFRMPVDRVWTLLILELWFREFVDA